MNQEWIEEFDKKFDELYLIPPDTDELGEDRFYACSIGVKKFIQSLLDQAVAREREILADRISEIQSSCHSWQEYNRKLDDLINSIRDSSLDK